ncbi:MAG: hypothetical protein PHU23_06020 [Dehalococcoidales bacterium]|nr:hypothetical protein [Dehalococcoidales bacterium]
MSEKPLLYDVYCCQGGATKGYQKAGFRVIGIDHKPQPHYIGDSFILMDALEFLDRYLKGEFERADAFHASPPCQGYSVLAAMHPDLTWDKLIDPTRKRLKETASPYVIENVETAPLSRCPDLFGNKGVVLCGSMFGLKITRGYLRRHRIFETSFFVPQPPCNHSGKAVGVYGHGGHTGKLRMLYRQEASEAMRIDWMNRDEMCQAIPSAYTEFIGKHLMNHLMSER